MTAPTSSILSNFISCKIVLTNMTFFLLDLIGNCADQPSINKLISPTNSPNFTPQLVLCCSVHFPTQTNIRHTIILLTVFLVAASNVTDWVRAQTDRQQERSHYRRQLPKYFVWVELFSQVFIQSETLGENVKLLYGVFQVSVERERESERDRDRSLQGVAGVMK